MLRKSTAFSNVFINQDLTPMQQMESTMLRKELKERKGRGEDAVIHRKQVFLREDVQHFR